MSTVTYQSQTDKTPTVIQLSKRRPFCARKSAKLTVHCELLLHKEVTVSCVRLVAYRLSRPRVVHATVVRQAASTIEIARPTSRRYGRFTLSIVHIARTELK